MGVNNRQRRAAKQKKRARQSVRSSRAWDGFVPEVTPEQAREVLVEALTMIDADAAAAGPLARRLCDPAGPVPPALARQELRALLEDVAARVVAQGWRATDLAQVVRRRLREPQVPLAVGLVADETARHPQHRVAAAWRDDLREAGRATPLDLSGEDGVQAALELAACLATLPPVAVLLPPPGEEATARSGGDTGDPKLLAKVRALLSKAESTEYDEEAEALTAKAQELISRHALQRLLDATPSDRERAQEATTARRIWIDAPYVFAKAMIVGAVAEANHCRSVVSEDLGFCTVVGRGDDLASLDVLVTSLLLQAGAAMRRHGRQQDQAGTSRTRSFRQSFLVSYAHRIAERLDSAAHQAVQSTGRAGELVPVLHLRAEQVQAATEELFPHLTTRAAAVGNAQGWVAGRAAADLARLDTAPHLEQAG